MYRCAVMIGDKRVKTKSIRTAHALAQTPLNQWNGFLLLLALRAEVGSGCLLSRASGAAVASLGRGL